VCDLVKTILREREVLNERRVAVARLALVSGAVALDLLAYAGWVQTMVRSLRARHESTHRSPAASSSDPNTASGRVRWPTAADRLT